MPVTYITIEWPNNEKDQIYSPSSVIAEFFNKGEILTVDTFLIQCQKSLSEASERVRQKFGYACTSAEAESYRIKQKCQEFDNQMEVKIKSIN